MKLLDWLTVLFVGLKLTDIIDWSWWLVLAPTLVPLMISIVMLCIVYFTYGSTKGR